MISWNVDDKAKSSLEVRLKILAVSTTAFGEPMAIVWIFDVGLSVTEPVPLMTPVVAGS